LNQPQTSFAVAAGDLGRTRRLIHDQAHLLDGANIAASSMWQRTFSRNRFSAKRVFPQN